MTRFSSSRTAAHCAFPCFPAPEQLMHTQAQKGGAPTISSSLPSLSPPAKSLSEQVSLCPGEDPATTADTGLTCTHSLLIYRTSLLTAALQMNSLKVDMQ